MMELIEFQYDQNSGKTFYRAVFRHMEYIKSIDNGYFLGNLTEAEVLDKLTEYYNNWINWLS